MFGRPSGLPLVEGELCPTFRGDQASSDSNSSSGTAVMSVTATCHHSIHSMDERGSGA
jgi:hypothetical protein